MSAHSDTYQTAEAMPTIGRHRRRPTMAELHRTATLHEEESLADCTCGGLPDNRVSPWVCPACKPALYPFLAARRINGRWWNSR